MSVCLAAGDVFVPVKIEENDLYTGVLKLLEAIKPSWDPNHIKFKTLTDGITNKLVSCRYSETNGEKDIILVRVYGNKTDLFIDRTAEIRNIKALNVLGLAPQIYGIFENGLAYQYYPGNTLDVDTVIDDKIWPLVAKKLAMMHKVELGKELMNDEHTIKILYVHEKMNSFSNHDCLKATETASWKMPKEPFVWDKIEQFLSLLPQPFSTEKKQTRFTNSFGSISKLRIEYERLKSYLSNTGSPIVFAHNDLLLGNVVYNKDEGKISFIDYEYSAYSYQAFDIANHFNEFVGLTIEDIDYNKYPSKEFQLKWISVYLKEYLNVDDLTEEQVENVYVEVQQLALLSHFLWGVWSLVQYEHSNIDFDFARYSEIRLGRYFELKDKIFKNLS